MAWLDHVISRLFDNSAQELRVTTHEWLALMEALAKGAVPTTLLGFYWTARAVLVKRESDYDRFDIAFAQTFDGVEASGELIDQILDWLKDKKPPPHLSADELAALQEHDLETLRRLFEERLKEQTERHDGGNKWVGTGGTSPFGHGGINPAGVRRWRWWRSWAMQVACGVICRYVMTLYSMYAKRK